MRFLCALAALLAAAAAVRAADPAKADPPAPAPAAAKEAEPAYEPTASYTVLDVEGWPVYVHQGLLAKKDLWEPTLRQLRAQLYHVTRMVPGPAVARLRQVRIWVEENPKVACMCYHPSRRWLAGNGFNPEKARSVELGGPANFVAWTHHQFNMVLHELAHAYHHQVLGYDHPGIKAAYAKAMEAKAYEKVLRFDGKTERAYGANNDQEYFAELSEAWFGTNDFYPFVRAEVLKHDPEMAKVLEDVWTAPPQEPKAEPDAKPEE